jgi:hypothetical protein
VVRYAWWSPLVPALVGAALVAGFAVTEARRPASRRWLPDPDPHSLPIDWAIYAARWVMPFAGLVLFVLALVYLRRVLRGTVAFAVASEGVYWCPSGKKAKGRWFPWNEVTVIEFHAAEGGSSGRGAIALRGNAPPDEELPRLVSTRLGGWHVNRRRLGRALGRFAPEVEVVG